MGAPPARSGAVFGPFGPGLAPYVVVRKVLVVLVLFGCPLCVRLWAVKLCQPFSGAMATSQGIIVCVLAQ